MIRLLIVLVLAALVWFAAVKIIQAARRADVDWTGVTAFVAFIVMAFWLRHVTGMG